MKLAMIFSVLVASSSAISAEVNTSTVKDVKCISVQKEDTTVGTLVGGAVGGTAGSVIGKSLFGKGGSLIGGLVGAGAGGLLGSSGDEIYDCTMVTVDNEIVRSVSDRSIRKGEIIRYATRKDGTQIILD